MTATRSYPHKNIRLEAARYVGRSCHFVTICCYDRRTLLANPARAERLIQIVRKESDGCRFAVHAFCVMPDHVHLLVSGLDDCSDLLAFLRAVKRTSQWEFPPQLTNRKTPTEKRAQNSRATVAATKPALWQKKFYDHILRETDNFDAVAGYIWMNPVRAGLCTDPRDYPYSGSFTTDWKKIMRPLESWTPEWKKKTITAT